VIDVKKLSLLVTGAVGYVLGTRAGRERYDQIKRHATRTWNRPTVQNAVDDVEQAVRHTAADVGSKVADVASDAKSVVTDTVMGHSSPAPADDEPQVHSAP